jgi:tetratricopeptide (TPR) repeat protein
MKQSLLAFLILFICFQLNGQVPINEIPMYGHVQKTDKLRKIDDEFIQTSIKEFGNRKIASKEYVKFGWRYFYKFDFSTAIKRFNQSWLLDSTNVDTYYGFAAYMKIINDSVQSKYFRQLAESIDSSKTGLKSYLFSLAYFYEYANQIENAINSHLEYLKIDSNFTYSLKQLGYLYMNQNDTSNSLKYLNKAIKLNPSDSLSYLNRGWLYYTNKMYDNALRDFSKAIEIQPTYISAYANRANLYYNTNQYDKAIQDYYKCIELVPISEQGQFYRLIGIAKIKNNDKVGGCNCIAKSIEMGDTYKNLDKKELKKFYKDNCK